MINAIITSSTAAADTDPHVTTSDDGWLALPAIDGDNTTIAV